MTEVVSGTGTRRSSTRSAVEVGLVAFVVAAIAQLWSHRENVVFAFWDAQAHLDIARRVIDSTTPGLQMLGTVWLPIPHLLLLGPVQVDAWWWNGLAGGIVGIAAYVAIVVATHDILVRRTTRRSLALVGTAVVALNPSLLYLQSTAMTEPVLLAFLVASAALLDRWNSTANRTTLAWSGVLAALAVGSRYDGWFFAAVGALVVTVIAFRRKRPWLSDALVFATPTALMVGAWLLFNYAYFGDALEFQRGVWSAQSQQSSIAAQGLLPTIGRPDLAVGYYLGAAAMACGALTLCLALVLSWWAIRGRGAIALLLLGSSLVFNVIALVAGQSVIALPWTTPAGYLNIRYGVMLLPAVGAAIAFGLDRLRANHPRVTRVVLGALALQLAAFAIFPRYQVGALSEGLSIRDGDPRQQAGSTWLRDHYDGGRVLVDGSINVSPRSRVALRDRVHEWTWQLGAQALAAPERTVDWVVADSRTPDDAVSRAIGARPEFRKRFDLVFSRDGYEIWRRR